MILPHKEPGVIITILFVIYDGIQNSVFQSQVLQPITQLLRDNKNLSVTLLSFEKEKIQKKDLKKVPQFHARLNILIAPREAAWNYFGLKKNIKHFVDVVEYIGNVDCVIARGSFAGYIARRGIVTVINSCTLTIQARGLAAEELLFVNKYTKCSVLRKLATPFLYWWYRILEKKAYCAMTKSEKARGFKKLTVESVSVALKEYVVKRFGADSAHVTIAKNDIPSLISDAQIAVWRKKMRKKLGISIDAYVYCYMGSVRPWQCVDETIEYFVNAYRENDKAFLLVLTQDREVFEEKLKKAFVPYKTLTVPSEETCKYLAACDAGLLLRKKHIVNFVSRPTKALEYRAVGLKIIHNNTVDWLIRGDKV